LDRNAADHPHLVTIATSNFTEALDEAFKSRTDASIEIPLPDAEAITAILGQTLNDFAAAYPPLASLSADKRLSSIAQRLVGADGRQVRKVVTDAMSRSIETVQDPGRLTLAQLRDTAADLTVGTPRGGRHAAA
jgi:AAA+ superfamily predicted ATPase